MTTKRITLYKPIRTQEQLKTDHVYIMAHSSTSWLSLFCLFCLLVGFFRETSRARSQLSMIVA